MSEVLSPPPQKPSLAAKLKAWLFDLWLAFLDVFAFQGTIGPHDAGDGIAIRDADTGEPEIT